MKSQPRRRPYRSGVARQHTRPRLESSSATDPSPGRVSKFAAWTAGIVASCLVAVAGFWINQRGEDTVAELRGEPALKSLVTINQSSSFEVVFGRGPFSREDYAKLRLSSGEKAMKVLRDLVDNYNGVPAKLLKAQIVLTGGRNQLTVLDIAVRHQIHRAEPPTGGYLFVLKGQGSMPSAPITVNLDLQDPLFEITDKPGIRYFGTETVSLKRDESFTFEVDFLTNAGYHEFDLVATYLLGDRKESSVIAGPDNGVFKLAGVADDYRAYGSERYRFNIFDEGKGMSNFTACDFFAKPHAKPQEC